MITSAASRETLQNYYKQTFVNQTRTNAVYSLASVSGVPALLATDIISKTYYDNYAGDAYGTYGYTTAAFAASAPAPQVPVTGKGQF